jgi:hypothetical protein
MGESQNVATVRRFYDIADGRITGDFNQLMSDLFTEDVHIYRPKFVGSGLAAMLSAGEGRAFFRRIDHHADEFKITESGDRVIIEGTTEGETVTGIVCYGRKAVAGRFCSIFDFRGDQVCAMHVTLILTSAARTRSAERPRLNLKKVA